MGRESVDHSMIRVSVEGARERWEELFLRVERGKEFGIAGGAACGFLSGVRSGIGPAGRPDLVD